jgi:hypothetical protein
MISAFSFVGLFVKFVHSFMPNITRRNRLLQFFLIPRLSARSSRIPDVTMHCSAPLVARYGGKKKTSVRVAGWRMTL